MLAASLQVPSGGSIVAKLPFRKVGVRRIIITAPSDSVKLMYDGITLVNFTRYNGFVDLKFESYYGFPDASKFSFVNYDTHNANVTALVDYVAESNINNDYFEVQAS
jgi:hypothetical protein